MTIKSKLTIAVVVCLFVLAAVLVIISVNKSTQSLLQAEMNKLSTVESAKRGEISNYLISLKGLLVSLANHQGTKEAFAAFENGYYKLNKELKLDIDDIKSKLAEDFKKNYLDSVNYEVPNSKHRKSINDYLPQDSNSLTAQYIFITDNSAPLGEKNNLTNNSKYDSTYMKAHKKYHKSFDKFLVSYELYDIFMTDLKGNLIYTDFKEKDYATNLKSGVYNDTGIARVYQKALQLSQGEIAFDDFAPYEPSYNSAASFIATPIFIDGTKKGVLIFQMPVDRINAIMQFNGKFKDAGLGESGEAYLVGTDYKMRSNSRFQKDIKDPVVQKLGSTIGVWEVKTASSKAVVNGEKKGKWIIPDYRGVKVVSVFGEIDLFGQGKWAIIAEIDEDEALMAANELRSTIILISVGVLLLIVVGIYVFVNNQVIKPLNNFQEGLLNFFKYLNRENSDVQLLSVKSNDEIGKMSNVVNENITKTQIGIEEDRKVIDDTINVLAEFEQGDLHQRVNVTTSNPSLQELTNLLNKMGSNLEKNIDGILAVLGEYSQGKYLNKVNTQGIKEHLLKLSNGINTLGESTTDTLVIRKRNGLTLQSSANTLKRNVENLTTSSNEAAASLEETAAALEEITSTIISNSDNVTEMAKYADRVTASASSGEELANNTMGAMDEINDQVTSINEAITVIDQIAFQTNILSLNAAVEAATAGEAGKGFAVVAQEVRNLASRSADAAKEIKEIVETATVKANAGKKIAEGMLGGYIDLNKDIDKTIELISNVDAASKEQQAGIEQINDAVTQLDQQTQRNSAAALETNDIAVTTEKLAETIINGVNQNEFRGKDDVEDRRDAIIDLSYQGKEKRKPEGEIKERETSTFNHSKRAVQKKVNKTDNHTREKITPKIIEKIEPKIASNKEDKDEWESF